jgi:hypothetical protein
MSVVRYVVAFVLLLLPSSGFSDACSDLQAAIAKTAALRIEMQRETAPYASSGLMPTRHEGVCAAAQKLRDQLAVLAKLIDPKCLTEDEMRELTSSFESHMQAANGNIGLYCN